MQAVVIYRDKKGYIFTPIALTEAGFGISIEPEIRIYFNAGATKIASALREVLNVSRVKIKTPILNRKLTNEQREAKKVREQKMDIKSFAELDRKPVMSCHVYLEEDVIKISPQMHDPEMNGVGYTGMEEEEGILVLFNASDELIFKAIEEAFSRCK